MLLHPVAAVAYSDISDHLPIAVHINCILLRKKNSNQLTSRIYDRSSVDNFNRDLCNSGQWNNVFHLAGAESNSGQAYDCFYNIYKTIFDRHFPVSKLKLSHKLTPRHEWMSKGLIKS